MVQRKWSKNTTLRKAARSLTIGTADDPAPRAPWDKYLKFFDHTQLEVMYQSFDENDVDGRGVIGVDFALQILATWNSANHDLEELKPSDVDLQKVLAELGIRHPMGVTELNFDLLVKFVRLCETKVIQADPRAGFQKDELRFLEGIFETHSKERLRRNPDGSISDDNRRSLSTTDVFATLEDMGRDTTEVEQQLPIVEIIKEMDVDRSGDLDFAEFLHFARKVRMMDAAEARELERNLTCNSGFDYTEIQDLLQLFEKYDEERAGVFQIYQFIDLVESNQGKELDKEGRRRLKDTVKEYGCLDNEDDPLSFGQFLGIMQKLIDGNVCGLKASVDNLQLQMEDDQRYLSPEEYELKYQSYFGVSKTCWLIRKLITNKVDKQQVKLEKKKASKEKSLIGNF
jgi:Ca2+-binding EF-hand superfamily protein